MTDSEWKSRRFSMREILTFVTVVTNICALVWGAAKLSDSVENLQSAVKQLQATSAGMAHDIADIKIDYNARIRVLEAHDGVK